MTKPFPINKYDFHSSVGPAIERARHTHNSVWRGVTIKPGDPYEGRLFRFTRICRSIPQMQGLQPHEALRVVEAALSARDLGWRDFAGISDSEEAQIEFLYLWEAIRFGVGEQPLTLTKHNAEAKPLNLNVEHFPTKLYRRFLSFAYHLQSIMGEQNIFLPCAAVSLVLGCSAQMVSNMSRMAQKAGLLDKVKGHNFAGRQAAEYKVNNKKLLAECDTERPFAEAVPSAPEPDTPF